MNERIQELAYQAEEYADTIVDQGGEFHPAYTEKLAELIVRECATIVDKATGRRGNNTIGSVLKTHFGVKQ